MHNVYRNRRVSTLLLATAIAVCMASAAPAQVILTQAPQPVPLAPVPNAQVPTQGSAQAINPATPRIIENVPSVPARPSSAASPQTQSGRVPLVTPPNAPAAAAQGASGDGRQTRPSATASPVAIPIPISPERSNPFQSPTNLEQRDALQARIIQNAIEATVRQVEERMKAEIDSRVRELEAEAQNRARSQAANPAGPARPGSQPGTPGAAPRTFTEFRSSHSLVRRTNVGAGVPDNWRLVGCINGRAIYNDGKVNFEHDDGEAGSHCGRRRPDGLRLQ